MEEGIEARLGRILFPCMVGFVFILLGGCVYPPQKVTYPSPHPVGGVGVVYPGEFATVSAAISAGVKGFESLCRLRETGITRSSVAFKSDGVQFCVYTPDAGNVLTCMSVYGIERHGPLKFEIYVSGADAVFDHLRARHETSGQSLESIAEITDAPYAGGIEEAPPNAKPMYPGARVLLYSMPRKELVFRFSLPCDPNAHYRLSVAGLNVKGDAIQVPPVEFDPYTEWRATGLD